ncbi:helix-turn-helix domain-containing protein [Salinibaculum rarum]|jgi:predicted transcriptional regulator|uniref:helix-turn-helix domain-containing protein n=1 Tax=Salinibaculum rarum TaxID=3058903 RepID=UPI00265F2870|nr:helix-turn-helix domain-containing protein [Salinibaculum sp. KK48]
MTQSMQDMLRSDMECEGLLECFHGLTALDRAVFETMVAADEAKTVDEIAEEVDRERSTAYRSVKRLEEAGFLTREQRTYDGGGYYHVFTPADPKEVADDMQRMLNDWYAKMGGLIGEFRDKYNETIEPQT